MTESFEPPQDKYEQPEDGIAELLCAVSFATSLGLGEQMEHGLKSAYIGLRTADALGLGPQDREAVYYGALLKDAGCTACSTAMSAFFPDDELAPRWDMCMMDPFKLGHHLGWLSRNVPVDAGLPVRLAKLMSLMVQCTSVLGETQRAHCEVAEMTARRLGFPEHVQKTVRYQYERWDGRSFSYKLKGDDAPITGRILFLAQIFAFGVTFGGPDGAKALVKEGQGSRFDPELADALLKVAEEPDFWSLMEREPLRPAVLAMRPATDADKTVESQVDTVCEVLADIADGKHQGNWYHSATVAEVAVEIGRYLGLHGGELADLRRAGLLHDLGQIAIPAGILKKGDRLSESEWEVYRLHPYYTQRVLAQVRPLSGLAEDAASHHEWVNGEGYHRGLGGEAMPLGGKP